MSLINDVLRDLDESQARGRPSPEGPLAGLRPVPAANLRRGGPRWLTPVALLGTAFCAFALGFLVRSAALDAASEAAPPTVGEQSFDAGLPGVGSAPAEQSAAATVGAARPRGASSTAIRAMIAHATIRNLLAADEKDFRKSDTLTERR